MEKSHCIFIFSWLLNNIDLVARTNIRKCKISRRLQVEERTQKRIKCIWSYLDDVHEIVANIHSNPFFFSNKNTSFGTSCHEQLWLLSFKSASIMMQATPKNIELEATHKETDETNSEDWLKIWGAKMLKQTTFIIFKKMLLCLFKLLSCAVEKTVII